MKIFAHEIQDGIDFLSDKIFAECNILSCEDFKGEITEALSKTIANYIPSNPNQIDLHYLNCILASVGWNKNEDVFDKEEFIKAVFTPEDKPFNYMHDESDIIGHITGSMLCDHNGNKIDLNQENIPDNLDIIVSAVIYKSWSDIEQYSRIKELIEEIKNNQWAVSMECLFRNFDYALIDDSGEQKIVARNDSTSFLTKHLKCYGGTGVYDKYKIGRLLRNITFSGIGVVKRPANQRSIIINNENILGEKVMTTAAEEKNEDFKAKADELQITVTQLSETNSKLKDEVFEKDKTIATLEVNVLNANKETEKAKSEVASMTEQLKAMENKIRCMERRSVLASMNLDEDAIMEILEDFKEKDDEAFASAVKMSRKIPKASVVETVAETVETTEDVEVEVEDTEADTKEDVEVVITEEENSLDKVQASIASWFQKSVLSTTKNLK